MTAVELECLAGLRARLISRKFDFSSNKSIVGRAHFQSKTSYDESALSDPSFCLSRVSLCR